MTVAERVLLAAILLLAATVRVVNLDLTQGVWSDEAVNGTEGIAAVKQHDFKVFYPTNFGREGLYINMVGISEAMLGVNVFALRLPAALAGTLTVWFVFLLGRQLRGPGVGLTAAWLSATGFWHVAFSRISLRAILVPLFLTASIYFLLCAVSSLHRSLVPRTLWLAGIAGVFFGLGFHSYISFRIAPILVLLYFVLELRAARRGDRKRITPLLKIIAVFSTTCFVVALPILVYFSQHPRKFVERSAAVSVFSASQPVRALVRSFRAAAEMFNIRGDGNWRHNIAWSPELIWPVGILFVIGIVSVLWPHARIERDRTGVLLLAWLIIMMLPEVLAVDSQIPNSLRALAAAPAAYILAAIGCEALFKQGKNRRAVTALIAIALFAVGSWDLYRYFGRWAHDPQLTLTNSFCQRESQLSMFLKSLPSGPTPLVVIPGPAYPDSLGDYAMPSPDIRVQPIAFFTYGHAIRYVYEFDLTTGKLDNALRPGTVVLPLTPTLHVAPLLAARHSSFVTINQLGAVAIR